MDPISRLSKPSNYTHQNSAPLNNHTRRLTIVIEEGAEAEETKEGSLDILYNLVEL